MHNLISNAIKFTKPGGRISIYIKDKGNSVVIGVKDTGIGIPKEKQHIIFERFRQIDKSLTREHEGSGIGLSLVKSLVELHKGNISLISEPGCGSEFIIELPVDNKDVYSYKASDAENRMKR
jgi:two-component system CheB/CheR fusion protein